MAYSDNRSEIALMLCKYVGIECLNQASRQNHGYKKLMIAEAEYIGINIIL